MRSTITSPFQLDVAAALQRLGLATQLEFSPDEEVGDSGWCFGNRWLFLMTVPTTKS